MWNDKETNIDLLGHNMIAQTIMEIINDNHLRPLTIGVYGDWGVGKSSILSLLQNTANMEGQAGISKNTCILFNSWLFQGYEDAKTALMETVVSELAKLQPKSAKIQTLAKSLFKRINWLKLAKLSSSAAVTLFTGVPLPGMFGEMPGWVRKSRELISSNKGEANNKDNSLNEDEPFLKEIEEESVTQQVHAFREEFKKLIESSKVDHVIILVDDLDRCLPKAVIEILEAIRLLLFVEGTTFILSADEKMIEYAVKEHFPNLPSDYQHYTRNYLEKLIQIPIRIPLLNKVQTGNYIKLLMLQYHLKHNYEQLQQVYEFYGKTKKRPYDAVHLSYEVISDAIGSQSSELKETILVANQLTPTLAGGLKGNPRNIKRFMNTLFLRMRVARIYGLNDVVELKVLAKLMLLERFQPKYYDKIVEEVTSSENGNSSIIAQEEKLPEEQKTGKTGTEESDKDWVEWLQVEPSISSIDLRPYIFISKEKAIGFDTDNLFPEALQALLQKLNSHSDLGLRAAESELQTISPKERILLFDKLEAECQTSADFKNVPDPINGLLRIIKVDSTLEDRLINLIDSLPPSGLGLWAIFQFIGLKNPLAIQRFKGILEKWSKQDENMQLKQMAIQQSKQ